MRTISSAFFKITVCARTFVRTIGQTTGHSNASVVRYFQTRPVADSRRGVFPMSDGLQVNRQTDSDVQRGERNQGSSPAEPIYKDSSERNEYGAGESLDLRDECDCLNGS
jgi:hypothetical protein